MNLYLIKTLAGYDYDDYDSAVVAAPSAEQAKKIQPSGINATDGWPTDPAQIDVKFIGIAARDTEAGVILASFNAG